MMKKSLQGIFFLSFILCPFVHLYPQTSNTMYFMKGVPYRHAMNPSLQPTQDFYLSLPLLSYFHVNVENNSVSLKDIFQHDAEGNTVYFLNPTGNKNQFFSVLKPTTMFNTDVKINLLGAGLRIFDDYITLDISQRVNSQAYIPKDLLKLFFYGTPDLDNNVYDMHNFAFEAQTFTDVSVGYSHTIDKRLYLGGRLKILLGNNNKSFSHSKLNLSANIEEWNFSGNGVLRSSGADNLQITGRFEDVKYTPPTLKNVMDIAGLGAGIDLGMSYRIDKDWTFSASLTDVGFINWTKNTANTKYWLDYNYTGIQKELNDGNSFQNLIDSLSKAFSDARKVTNNEGKAYNSYLLPKINLGLERSFYNNKLSLGVFSRTTYRYETLYNEITASVNGRPVHWLDASLSYSLNNGRFSAFGAGLGIKTGPLYWFATMDYIAFNYVPVPLQKIDASLPNLTLGAPYNSKAFNVAMGVTIVLDNLKWFKSLTPSPFYDENSSVKLNSEDCNCGWK